MIITTPTKYYAGVSLWGDYWDLRSLHSTIHDLVANSPYDEGIKDTILGLAYDIRKAYEKQRDEKNFGYDDYDSVTYRGGKILWPIILFQVKALRDFAAFQPTTKEQQANLYRLEYCLEKSLTEIDPKIGQQCIDWLNGPSPLVKNYYTLFLSHAAKEYAIGSTGKARFKKLPAILRSLYPLSDEYTLFAKSLEAQAIELECDPKDLHDFSDDGEVKW